MSDTPPKKLLPPRLRVLLARAYRAGRARRRIEQQRMMDWYEDLAEGLDDAQRDVAIAAAGDEGVEPDEDE